MIRPATLDDIPVMVELGRKMHGESPVWSRLAYAPEKVASTIERLIEHPDGFAWVALMDGVIVGAFLAMIEEHWMSSDRVASELALFVEKTARGALLAARLVCAGVAWAKIRKSRIMFAGASTGLEPERTAQFYERFGFERNGAIALERMM